MTMNDTVFRALLAMDSYNRGYDAGIDFGQDPENQTLGNSTIIDSIKIDPDDPLAAQSVATGFYAATYQWGNEKIISFRGTDAAFCKNPRPAEVCF